MSDADLRYAQQYYQSPQLATEIRSRRLDCVTGTRLPPPKAAKKPNKPSKLSAGDAVGDSSKTPAASGASGPVDPDALAPHRKKVVAVGRSISMPSASRPRLLGRRPR